MVMGVQGCKTHNMVRLTEKQLQTKLNFIKSYCNANNAADGSTFDPNSNVTHKNVATLAAEINKDINIQLKRRMVLEYINKYFPDVFNEYIRQLEEHEIYAHDETGLMPYCSAVSLYPFLQNGLQDFGGESKAPKHLSSFNGGFINLIFALSSQFCGAIATVEYLMCFDHFAKLDYGENYLETHKDVIQQELQQVVYALNQPASARNFQSCFWNISIFDKFYFEALFKNFVFPDGSKPEWKTVSSLQQFFLNWFNQERTKALLTFPVVTIALLNDSIGITDREYADITAKELSKGNSFFVYTSNTVDSLSSCCRLRNDISDQLNDFSYSLGAGGVMTGSINVITLNMNRFIQNCVKKHTQLTDNVLGLELANQIEKIHKYQIATRRMFEDMEKQGMLPAYTANFINFNRQYCTIGINGLVESAEFLKLQISNNKSYLDYIGKIFRLIANLNKQAYINHGIRFNTELVPAENLGVKFARWDKKDHYKTLRDCYNSYLYRVEDENLTIIDKFNLHGCDTTRYLDGGSALHLNLEEIPSYDNAQDLLRIAVQTGCNYFCTNVKVTICNDCKFINKETKQCCTACGSKNIDYGTRVIGYLRRITNFTQERKDEEAKRYYHKS